MRFVSMAVGFLLATAITIGASAEPPAVANSFSTAIWSEK